MGKTARWYLNELIQTRCLTCVFDYIQAHYRMSLKGTWLVRPDIERIVNERKEIARDCYLNGECLHCGCETPDKFYASRGCKEEGCYKKVDEWIILILKRFLQKLKKLKF